MPPSAAAAPTRAFGAQGAAPVLAKVTYWLAAIFLATSLLIEFMIVKENRSVLDKSLSSAPVSAPAPRRAPPRPLLLKSED